MINKDAWERAQIKEEKLNGTLSFEDGDNHFRKVYGYYFQFVDADFDLKEKSIIEIGPANFPALRFCNNISQSFIIEPTVTEHLKQCVENINVEIIGKPAEDVDFPEVDEVWFFNILQHTLDPALIIEKAKKAAKVIRFFEPIEAGIDECHLHEFTMDYFRGHFGDCVKYYAAHTVNDTFHQHQCAYGVYNTGK